MATLSPSRAFSSETSTDVADTFSHVASLSSTPPTTVGDGMSITSELSKHDHTLESTSIELPTLDAAAVATLPEAQSLAAGAELVTEAIEAYVDAPSTPIAAPSPDIAETSSSRPRRQRNSLPVYNIAKLSGTAVHGKRRANGDLVADKKRRTISGASLVLGHENGPSSDLCVQNVGASPKSKNAKKRALSPEPLKRSTRSSGLQAETLATKISSLGKRSKKTFVQNLGKMTREMRRLQDTNEFSGIEVKPVLYTTWAKGKFVDPDSEPPRKKTKVSEPAKEAAAEEAVAALPEVPAPKRRVKKWLAHGLYSGQDAPLDFSKHLTPNEKKALVNLPELVPTSTVNKVLPMPIFAGLRMLIQGRDFKLPFDICNPLPSGQPKPASWKLMTRNRFIGEAGALWKKSPHFKDYQSKCVCTAEDGCTESCQNRIMLYECDSTNCNAGAATCQNRAFARLQERIKAGGKYRVGVEVLKTEDRGFGIRANRCFEPGSIIMEYTGEIITEEECERRMEDKYKDNECYYLMSFDQNMIIDATKGSIARFVNHSCQPNCRMIKWIVSGQPRMALFAGDRPIMTGEELTYDYNFDPFSAKNVQKCLCGAPNCRGVLGPKPKEVKPPKAPKDDLKKAVKKGLSAGKRKLQELLGDKEDAQSGSAKKRKIKAATGVQTKGFKHALSKASAKAARGAAKVVKKSVSTISVKSPKSGRKVTSVKHRSSIVKTYSKTKVAGKLSATPKKTASRKSNGTIAAAGSSKTPSSAKSVATNDTTTPKRGRGRPRKHPIGSVTPRKAVDLSRDVNQIRLVQSPGEATQGLVLEKQPEVAQEAA
ncbi:hypothetical protein SUNI508_08837 [Seiridium unicorne]|uniref:Histone-lysine N-methyltransferase ASH1L n=1 Tax=Seiridium unicorne TaxID=138068 RepID=A0ABR2USJ1_9PEZI